MCCITCDMREWFVAIYPMGKMVTQVIYAIWSMCQMSILYLYNRAQRQIGDERRLFGAHFLYSSVLVSTQYGNVGRGLCRLFFSF